MKDPNFGFHGTDRITGFKGVITGRIDYISGCSQYLLVPAVDKDGKKREGEWFDVQRIEIAAGKNAKNPAIQTNIHRIGSGRVLRPDGAPIDAVPEDGELYHPAHTERIAITPKGEQMLTEADLEAAYQRGMRFGIAFTCIMAFVITVGVLIVTQAGAEVWRHL